MKIGESDRYAPRKETTTLGLGNGLEAERAVVRGVWDVSVPVMMRSLGGRVVGLRSVEGSLCVEVGRI